MQVAPTVSNSAVRERARSTLLSFYDLLGRPSLFDFFPVNLEELVSSVLRWQIEGEAATLGTTKDGDVIVGRCDYDKEEISLLDSNVLHGPERRFALAHEIAHVILHRTNPLCSGGSSIKKRSLRARRAYEDSGFERLEREAQVFSSELLMPGKTVKEQFKRLVLRERLRAESSHALRIWEQCGHSSKGTLTLDDVVGALSVFTSPEEPRSLIEFFGVSKEAMRIRLLELQLVF